LLPINQLFSLYFHSNKMKHRIIFSFAFVLVTTFCYGGPEDSIGTKVKNGKIFIMHQVEKAQGLFAISRLYNIPLNQLIQSNPGADEMLTENQVIMIPTGKDAPKEQKVVKDYFKEDIAKKGNKPDLKAENTSDEKGTFAKYHTVVAGETLFSISVKYKTSVDVIKNLNNLKSDLIYEGSTLMVPSNAKAKEGRDDKIVQVHKRAETLKKEIKDIQENIQTPIVVAAAQVVKVNDQNEIVDAAVDEDVLEINVLDKAEYDTEDYGRKVEKIAEYNVEKVWEKGKVEVLSSPNMEKNSKVCSHHEAEIGTTVMVTNPANSKAVFVKVIENHSFQLANANIIVLSPTALDYVGLSEGETVEISFAR
jgi:LysM repeat protein/transcription elongation GreA/GreB family factor